MQDRAPRWWQTAVVYQVYPRSFADSDGDGTGDLNGISERLDYLAWLGVDAIWISPFYPSPMADFGYDVSDYTDVDPLFGTLADFDRLVAAAHERNIRVLVDYVPNHTSDQHPWFVESRASRDNPKADWYVWRDAKADGSLPNNWISMFAGPTWTWDETRAQYYLHIFLAEQPDLNWRNPEVRDAMFDVARFWLDRGVDGFRIDVAPMVMKDPELRDNPPNPDPGWEHSRLGSWLTQLHVNDHNHPDMHELYRSFRRLLETYPGDRVSIGELHHPDFDRWAEYYGERQDEIHVPFNFHVINSPWNADAVRRAVEGVQRVLPTGAWASWVLGNHDQPRIASAERAGRDQARVAMMLLLTLRGTPTLYYGDEIGMVDVPVAAADTRDPLERLEPGPGPRPRALTDAVGRLTQRGLLPARGCAVAPHRARLRRCQRGRPGRGPRLAPHADPRPPAAASRASDPAARRLRAVRTDAGRRARLQAHRTQRRSAGRAPQPDRRASGGPRIRGRARRHRHPA